MPKHWTLKHTELPPPHMRAQRLRIDATWNIHRHTTDALTPHSQVRQLNMNGPGQAVELALERLAEGLAPR